MIDRSSRLRQHLADLLRRARRARSAECGDFAAVLESAAAQFRLSVDARPTGASLTPAVGSAMRTLEPGVVNRLR